MKDSDRGLTAEDRSKDHTITGLIRGVEECIFYWKREFGRAPVVKEVSDRLWEKHGMSFTVLQLNTLILKNERLFEIASNGGFSVSRSGNKPKWYEALSKKQRGSTNVVGGRRDDAPIDDLIVAHTITAENGVVIKNPLSLVGERTKKNATAVIESIAALRRSSSKSPRKAGHTANEGYRRVNEEAYASSVELNNLMVQGDDIREKLRKMNAEFSAQLSGKK